MNLQKTGTSLKQGLVRSTNVKDLPYKVINLIDNDVITQTILQNLNDKMPEKNYILFVINIHLGIQTDSYDRDRIADEMKTCPNTILVHKPTPL